jgi:hypothetical protein
VETRAIDADESCQLPKQGLGMIGLTEEKRPAILSFWGGFVSLCSLFYLTGSFLKAATIGTFVLISCLLGFGQRSLLRAAFVIAIVAIAVALGAPSPDQWAQLFHDAQRTLVAGMGG